MISVSLRLPPSQHCTAVAAVVIVVAAVAVAAVVAQVGCLDLSPDFMLSLRSCPGPECSGQKKIK